MAHVLMRAVDTFERSGGIRFLAMFTAIASVLGLLLAVYSGGRTE